MARAAMLGVVGTAAAGSLLFGLVLANGTLLARLGRMTEEAVGDELRGTPEQAGATGTERSTTSWPALRTQSPGCLSPSLRSGCNRTSSRSLAPELGSRSALSKRRSSRSRSRRSSIRRSNRCRLRVFWRRSSAQPQTSSGSSRRSAPA